LRQACGLTEKLFCKQTLQTSEIQIQKMMKIRLPILILGFFALFFELKAQQGGIDWFMRAEEKRKQAQYAEAIEDYKIAVAREPKNYRYLYAKALAEYSCKRNADAQKSLQAAIAAEKTFADAYALAGKIYHENKDFERAYQMYDAAAKTETDVKISLTYTKYTIDYLITRQKFEAAYEKIGEISDFIGNDETLMYWRFLVNNRLKKYVENITFFKTSEGKIAAFSPADAAGHYYEAGYAFYFSGNYEEAFRLWEKVSTAHFKNKLEIYVPVYLEKCALAYAELEEYEDALFFVEKLKRINPDNAVIYFILGNKEIHQLDLRPALKNFLLAARFEKEHARSVHTYRRIAEIELELGNFKNSLDAAERGISLAPLDEDLLFVRAHALYKLKQFPQAIDALTALAAAGKDEVNKSKYWLLAAKSAIFLNDNKRALQFLANVTQGNYKTAANYEFRMLNKDM
jgi:tetratricopeptide (TPR) repeat protein